MTRKKISTLRREELIQAAINAIYENGFADLTVSQIARDAGTSTGSIHYYFGGKEALLEATMRHLLRLLRSALEWRLREAHTPLDRLHAVVQANLDDTLMTGEHCRVWMQFWAFAPFHPSLSRLHAMNRARVRSNLVHPLRSLVPPQDLQMKTNTIQGYMDGIWVQIAQTGKVLDVSSIQREAHHFVTQSV